MKTLIIRDCSARIPQKFAKDWIQKVAKKLVAAKVLKEKPEPQLVVAFVESSRIQELNQSYRQKDYATDILSFISDEPGVLGELIISPDVIEKQAREHGLSFELELGYMLIHGVLHLLGYDHEKSRAAAREMFKIQDDVFEQLCKTSAHVTAGRKRRGQKKSRESSRKNSRAKGVSLTSRSKRSGSKN